MIPERSLGQIVALSDSLILKTTKRFLRLRPLTEDEARRHAGRGYVAYEKYPRTRSAVIGRYWTQAQLDLLPKGTIPVYRESIEVQAGQRLTVRDYGDDRKKYES